MIINSSAFPLGLIVLYFMLRFSRKGDRKGLLNIPYICAGICLFLWLVSAIVYPVSIDTMYQHPLNYWFYVYFFLSLFICGLIGAVFPFLGSAYWLIAALYPPRISEPPIPEVHRPRLIRLKQHCDLAFVLSAVIPMISVVLISVENSIGTTGSTLALGLLGMGSMIGFVIAYLLNRRIQSNIDTIEEIIDLYHKTK